MDNILFEKCGYIVENIEKKDANQIFKIMSLDIDQSEGEHHYLRERRILKQEIRSMFDTDDYTVIGIRHTGSDEYVGMSVSSIEDEYPWLGYFYIKKEYRKKMYTIVLVHCLINILYKNKTIQIGHINRIGFAKRIRSLTGILEVSIFNNDVGTRVENIINRMK